jgi:hypothetical protein
VWCSTTAFGLIRLPLLTLGVFSIFSGYFLGLGLMLDATVEDALDGKEEFGEVGTGPFCEARNKAFNHAKSFTV